jgi:hypothetical protein
MLKVTHHARTTITCDECSAEGQAIDGAREAIYVREALGPYCDAVELPDGAGAWLCAKCRKDRERGS